MNIAQARDEGRWVSFTGEDLVLASSSNSSADVVALPSLEVYEAFPYAVLEGMAHGKPILATNVGAVPDMLGVGTDEIGGICIEPGNEQQLELAIIRLRDHPDEGKHLALMG